MERYWELESETPTNAYFIGVKDSIGLVYQQLRSVYGPEEVQLLRLGPILHESEQRPAGMRYMLDRIDFLNSSQHLVLEFIEGLIDVELIAQAIMRLISGHVESVYIFSSSPGIVEQIVNGRREEWEKSALEGLRSEGRLMVRSDFELADAYFTQRG